MKVIVFDFEVFKYDTLLGAIILDNGKKPEIFQTWDLEEIKKFYKSNINTIWVGHNNSHYDNFILQAIVDNENPYNKSKEIIKNDKRLRLNLPLNYYDIMTWHFGSLKVIEAQVGKNISESEVDFDIDRPLNQEEKLLTESYNRDDLYQTFDNLKLCQDEFQLRFDIMSEFGLGLETLHLTEAQIAERVLKCKRVEGIEDMELHPYIYPQLRVKNQQALDFFLNEDYLTSKRVTINLCGADHIIAAGGIHAALKNYHTDYAYYFDVSGYYNLVMMNYNLLPRCLNEEGKKLYRFMYEEQLRLKKINPKKRGVYKTVLLAVYGAMLNQYCAFYDPWKGHLVTVTGEMFLIDLLEKLEPYAFVIQSNTDGIIAKPLPGVDDSKIKEVVDEWQARTGFVLKFDKIYNLHQRDVNNYMYQDEKGKINVHGEAVKYYNGWSNPFDKDSYNSKEPYIVHYAIVEYYINGTKPEETIEKYKNEYRMFQYICKPMSFDYLSWNGQKLQHVNRVFASNKITDGKIFKHKGEANPVKYSNLPENVFVFNNDLSSLNPDLIDYNYYVKRSYERIDEFRNKFEQLSLF